MNCMKSTMLMTVAVCAMAVSVFAADDPVLTAMQQELDRTMAQLQLPGSPKPYFVACSLSRMRGVHASAMFGALSGADDEASTYAHLNVIVRVGDYTLDNSNFQPKQMWGGWSRMDWAVGTPIDGDPEVLRRAIWWTVDQAYKKAVENLKRKQAVLANRSTPPVADDLAHAPVLEYESEETPQDLPDPASLQKQATDLSRVFLESKKLQTGRVRVGASVQEYWYVNSEGSKGHALANTASVSLYATAQADDGVMVGDNVQMVAERFAQLPPIDEQTKSAGELGKRVEAMRDAPLLEDFAGPVLFEGQAAAELCARILPEALSGSRLPVVEGDESSQWSDDSGKESLRRKIGRRIMATDFSVTDDPTAKSLDGIPLVGHGEIDFEGVKPQRVELVKNGILKTLLTTRTPDKKLPVSNGHAVSYTYGMSGLIPAAGTTSLFVQYTNGVDEAELHQRLLQTIKDQDVEYGLVVRRIPPAGAYGYRQSPGSSSDDEGIEESLYVFRVYPDGREELTRVVMLKGMTLPAFKDVLAAGRQLHVYNYFGAGGLQSLVAPSLLFEEGIVAKPERNIAKPPLLPSPMMAIDN